MRVGILANHPDDRRESMHRFARLLHDELNRRGVEAVLLRPHSFAGARAGMSPRWKNRFEKALFEWRLRRTRASDFDLIHVADQGNALYAHLIRGLPTVVTCHDLSALEGEEGPIGGMHGLLHRHLSKRMERGLRAATLVVSDSYFTQQVLHRVVGTKSKNEKVIHLGPQRLYKRLSREECRTRLNDPRLFERPFLLHVGANYGRKNRAVLIQALSLLQHRSELFLVLAGEPPTAEFLEQAAASKCAARIIAQPHPSDEMLEALYSTAFALVFPSFYEGFGWPLIEAQSCGCPVVCSNATCLPEVGGDGALYHEPSDAAQIAGHIDALFEPRLRDSLIERGTLNAARFSTDKMMTEYLAAYDSLRGPVERHETLAVA